MSRSVASASNNRNVVSGLSDTNVLKIYENLFDLDEAKIVCNIDAALFHLPNLYPRYQLIKRRDFLFSKLILISSIYRAKYYTKFPFPKRKTCENVVSRPVVFKISLGRFVGPKGLEVQGQSPNSSFLSLPDPSPSSSFGLLPLLLGDSA